MKKVTIYTEFDIKEIALRAVRDELRQRVELVEHRIRKEFNLRIRNLAVAINLDDSVGSLNFSVRTSNVLNGADIQTIKHLVSLSEHDLLRYRNLGKHSLNEIKDKLSLYGLELRVTGLE